MRCIALMSWYDESPARLAAVVGSVSRFCDHIVACDGAYRLYPHGRPTSGSEQAQAIQMTAEATGIGCTVHVPARVWDGNEVAKRDFLFRLGHLVAEPERDWFLVIDSDEVVTACDVDALRDTLADTAHNTATVMHEGYADHTAQGDHLAQIEHRTAHPARRLFRAAADPIRVEGQHWHYVRRDADGHDETLWGRGEGPAADIHGTVMEHRHHLRPPSRRAGAVAYYRLREAMRIEAGPNRRVEAAA